jgi:hypothetical protein
MRPSAAVRSAKARRTALMANRLEKKRIPWDGLIGSSARAVALPGTVVSLAYTTGGITGPHRDGSFVGISSHRSDSGLSPPRRCQTALRGRPVATPMTTDCHRTGDAPETSPFRRTGYSTRWLDPRGVTTDPGTRGGNRDPRRAFVPGPVASAQLDVGSAGGPHRCTLASDHALSQPEAGAGANPFATGSGRPPHRGHTGSMPQEISPARRDRPCRPSSAHSSPRRSGVPRVTSPCLLSPGGLGSGLRPRHPSP